MPSAELIDLLSDMVRIDSRNLHSLDYQGERPANEMAMAELCARKMQEFGFHKTDFQYIAPKRPNLLGLYMQNPAYPCLAFEAHLDTVGVDGMSIDPFNPLIKEGKLYGRGSCDTKGSLACMLMACRKIIAEKLPLNLLFLATSAEETSCEGVHFWDLSVYALHGVIVGEPTSNQPIIAHKAHVTCDYVIQGKAAHGSRPEAGDNAILKAARFLRFLEEEIIPELAAAPHDGFTSGNTLSIGLIRGGSKANIVAEQCTITCDLRILPGDTASDILHQQIAKRAEQRLGFPIHIDKVHFAPGMRNDPQSALLTNIENAYKQLQLPFETGSVAYCTDAGVLSRKGLQCVVLGPGNILNAHAAVEYIELKQLKQAEQIYYEIARQISMAK
ncbi:MAG: M20 family metallopeptidase [Oligosphaeraceae bacterium]|nr:M20 family metallopeptidase [Oligosphaeraceae bacterium]